MSGDNNGGFWIFGGFGNGTNGVNDRHFSLWRYNQTSNAFALVDGSTNAGLSAREASKPTPRFNHATWVDSNGNLWLFGGEGYDDMTSSTGRLSDTWVYNVSSTITGNRWRFISGSTTVNTRIAGQIEPREGVAHWRDAGDGQFYLFGGYGFASTGGAIGACKLA